MKQLSSIRMRRAQQMYDAIASAGGAGLTAKEISRAVGLKMSPYVWDLLAAGVERGWWIFIEREVTTGQGYRMSKLYFLPEAAQELASAYKAGELEFDES